MGDRIDEIQRKVRGQAVARAGPLLLTLVFVFTHTPQRGEGRGGIEFRNRERWTEGGVGAASERERW